MRKERTAPRRPPLAFASILRDELGKREISVKAFADQLGITYEHARRLVKGEGFPSQELVARISEKLHLPQDTAQTAATLDRIAHKYGSALYTALGIDPELAPLEKYWLDLTDEQKSFFENQIRLTAEANRRQRGGL